MKYKTQKNYLRTRKRRLQRLVLLTLPTYAQMMKLFSQMMRLEKNESVANERGYGSAEVRLMLFKNVKLYFI